MPLAHRPRENLHHHLEEVSCYCVGRNEVPSLRCWRPISSRYRPSFTMLALWIEWSFWSSWSQVSEAAIVQSKYSIQVQQVACQHRLSFTVFFGDAYSSTSVVTSLDALNIANEQQRDFLLRTSVDHRAGRCTVCHRRPSRRAQLFTAVNGVLYRRNVLSSGSLFILVNPNFL